jgi:hypothetical protein
MKLRLALLAACVAPFAIAPTVAFAADANGNHENYAWKVGATTPGDTAIAPDGSTITMSGRGTLMAGPDNTASGGGTFSLSSGGSGTWAATGVLGFVSYGPAGSGFPPGFTGGAAKLNVSLSNGSTGVLTIFCELGSPPAGAHEGITVVLGQNGQFTEQDGGNTVFIDQGAV